MPSTAAQAQRAGAHAPRCLRPVTAQSALFTLALQVAASAAAAVTWHCFKARGVEVGERLLPRLMRTIGIGPLGPVQPPACEGSAQVVLRPRDRLVHDVTRGSRPAEGSLVTIVRPFHACRRLSRLWCSVCIQLGGAIANADAKASAAAGAVEFCLLAAGAVEFCLLGGFRCRVHRISAVGSASRSRRHGS